MLKYVYKVIMCKIDVRVKYISMLLELLYVVSIIWGEIVLHDMRRVSPGMGQMPQKTGSPIRGGGP